LVEDALAAQSESPASIKPARSRSARSTETYTELARRDHQWRVTDFIPRGRLGLAAWFIAGIAIVGLLEVAYWAAVTTPLADIPLPGALDLAARASLAGYSSALALFGAAAVSALIYAVRRHRVDDYRGRYRVWGWAALLWFVASIDGVADLRALIRVFGVHLTGHTGPGDGIAWWLAPWLLVLSFVVLRASLDLRASWPALASFLAALVCWTASLMLERASLPLVREMDAAMLWRGLSLGGDWLLFCSLMVYGRYVLLEAHGELPTRRMKEKKEARKQPPRRDDVSSNEPVATKTPASLRIDTPHEAKATKPGATSQAAPVLKWAANSQSPAARPNGGAVGHSAKSGTSAPTAQLATSRTQFLNGSQDESQPGRTLSRAERKRLRREQRARERDE
jgi:hypothetical protein